MTEIGIHQGDDGFENFQNRPSSHEREIDSDEEERSMEPQVEEDVCNSSGLRKRKMKSSGPAEEDVRYPSELGNDKEKSSRSGRELDGVKLRDLLRFSIDKAFVFVSTIYPSVVEVMALGCAVNVIRLVIVLLLVLCSRSFSGELFQHVDSKDLHQNISEMRIVETPLHSVRSVAQDGKWVLKLARHDFLLLRTAGDKWYKAEKHGPSSGQAGIHIYPVTGPGAETIRFQSSISVDFNLAQALAILTDHKLDYSLWGENCWKYAHSRAEAILNSCIEIASDDNERNELKKENLVDARRRMPNEVVDIVQPWNIVGLVRVCFSGVCIGFWLGFGMNSMTRPSFIYEVMAFCSTLTGLFYMGARDPILAYNLTWLATTYRWHFNFLSFFGYFICWTLCPPDVESGTLEVEKHSEDPFLRTAVSGREDLDINHQDDSIEFQQKDSAVLYRLVLHLVMIFEGKLGYSYSIIWLRFSVCWWLLGAIKRVFAHDLNGRKG